MTKIWKSVLAILLVLSFVPALSPMSFIAETDAAGTLTLASGSTLSLDNAKLYINGVSDKVGAATLLSNFTQSNSLLVLKDNKGSSLTDEYAGTGATLAVNGGSTYTVIVKSDINGDGEITVTDYLMIKRTISKNYSLTAIQQAAADVNGKDGVDMADYTQTKMFFKGTQTALYAAPTPTLPKTAEYSVILNGNSSEITFSGHKKAASSGGIGKFTFDDTLTLGFLAPASNDFNKFKLTYSATQDISATVTYTYNNAAYNEEFFLEPSENGSFTSLIDGYLASGYAKQISKITFKSICGSSCDFSLKTLDTLKYTVYNSTIVYIENSRYKIGVKPAWGGGMSYLEDKNDGDATITNLLNNCDAGRLVQQSYYGTGTAPYECAKYNGGYWNYNPVQGGDQYNNPSKLVDIEIGNDYIYVKARPRDWAQKKVYTFAYMENRYTLTGTGVKVDNRFIDFSTYSHPMAHQELPAFYVISNLGTFTYYGGSSPWTNDTLTTKSSLPFWGDAAYEDCYFEVKDGNTETWCSWTNSSGYGVGLFVPDIEILLAGRFAYNGSKSAADGSTNYVAPLRTMKIQNFKAWEYSYIISSGTIPQIRENFKANKDLIDNTAWEHKLDLTKLTFSSYADVLNKVTGDVSQTLTSYDSELKALKLSVSEEGGNDPFLGINYGSSTVDISADKNKYIVMTYMVPDSGERDMEIFLCAGNRKTPEGGKSTFIKTTGDGKFHTAIIDCSSISFWTGTVNYVRLDYFCTPSSLGTSFYLKGLGFAATQAEAEALSAEFMK